MTIIRIINVICLCHYTILPKQMSPDESVARLYMSLCSDFSVCVRLKGSQRRVRSGPLEQGFMELQGGPK